MSLRRRLSVLVMIALTPPLLLTLYNTVRWQLVLEKEARDEVLASARLIGNRSLPPGSGCDVIRM